VGGGAAIHKERSVSGIRDLMATHRLALKVLEAGSYDCLAYTVWLDEFGGRNKLSFLEAREPLFPESSDVQQYAQLLVGQMNQLLAEGCSDELLLATYEYCDRLYDMVVEVITVPGVVGDAASEGSPSASPAAVNSNLAMAA